MALTNDDFDLAKFIKLMKMTTATTDGEALNAVRMANAMLKRNGHDWEALLKGKITIVNDPFGSIPTPPPAKAAPPPRPAPQPTAQPAAQPAARHFRDVAIVRGWFTILTSNSSLLTSYVNTAINRIYNDWTAYQALTDSEYNWLEAEVNNFKPKAWFAREIRPGAIKDPWKTRDGRECHSRGKREPGPAPLSWMSALRSMTL